jgi:hypothetical protein
MNTGHIDPTLVLHRLRDGALGMGLFSFHAGIFLLTAFSLFLWNLITDPSAMGVPAPRLIIPWGVLVLIHVSIVAVFSVARDALAPEEPAWVYRSSSPAGAPRPPGVDPSSTTTPPRPTSRFRPAGSTSLDDAREASQESVSGAWRRPVEGLRQATGAFRRDGSGSKPRAEEDRSGWRAETAATMSEEERRKLGSQQLASWRGNAGPAGNGGQGGVMRDSSRPEAGQQGPGTPVVRPIAPIASNFDEAEWTWLTAAASSHLARKGREPSQDSGKPSAPSGDGGKNPSSS